MRKGGFSKSGDINWSYRCSQCKHRKHRRNVSLICELCGFKATHKCQIDVDHIDGNHANSSKHNLQFLCSNCHRLKTFLNRDWETKISCDFLKEPDLFDLRGL